MDFTDLLGRDDLNAENKDLRRSIYIGFSNLASVEALMKNIVRFGKKFRIHLRENFLPRNFESDMLYSLFKKDEIPSTLQGRVEEEEEEEGDLELVCSSRIELARTSEGRAFKLGRGMRIAAKFKRRVPRHLRHGKITYPESSSSSSSHWSGSGDLIPLGLHDWDDSNILDNFFKVDKLLSHKSELPSTNKKTSTSYSDLDDLGGEDTAHTQVADQVRSDWLAAVNHYFTVHFKGEPPLIRAAELWELLNPKDQEFACCYCCSSRRSSPLLPLPFANEFRKLSPQSERKTMPDKSESSCPSMNTSTSDLEGGDTTQVAGRDCDILDLEIGCSSRRSSPLLTVPHSFTIADNFKRKCSRQVKKKKMLGYIHRSILFSKMPDKKISPFGLNISDSDTTISSQLRWARNGFFGRQKRYLNKSVKFYKMLQICDQFNPMDNPSTSRSSGSDLSDTERLARERAKWEEQERKSRKSSSYLDEIVGFGWWKPLYAHVKVLIFVNKSVCKKLAKYLGLIYIEDLLTEAKEDDNMFKFNESRGNLKYCSYIQPYIRKKLLSGCHDICLTHTLYLWETIYADYKGVISESDDKELYSEAKKDTNFYVELGAAPYFFLYLEAVTLIISGILRGPYYCIAKYRCEDFGENAYYPLKLSLIAFIPFHILCDLFWADKEYHEIIAQTILHVIRKPTEEKK